MLANRIVGFYQIFCSGKNEMHRYHNRDAARLLLAASLEVRGRSHKVDQHGANLYITLSSQMLRYGCTRLEVSQTRLENHISQADVPLCRSAFNLYTRM